MVHILYLQDISIWTTVFQVHHNLCGSDLYSGQYSSGVSLLNYKAGYVTSPIKILSLPPYHLLDNV